MAEEKPETNAIALSNKLAEFWTDKAKLWFVHTEAILKPLKLGEEEKFNVILAKFNKDQIQQISDILENPPQKDIFQAVKKRLLEVYEESDNAKLHRLLNDLELGDQKPSQLLRKMRDLSYNKMSSETLQMLWLGHLPANVRAVLTVYELQDLEKLALIADKILETCRPAEVAAVTQASTSSSELVAEVAKLSAQMAQLQQSHDGWNKQRSRENGNRSRSRSRSQGRAPQDRPDWLCFYHFRYRSNAKKCTPPCNWKNKESEN